jgi:hypothetical protein
MGLRNRESGAEAGGLTRDMLRLLPPQKPHFPDHAFHRRKKPAT